MLKVNTQAGHGVLHFRVQDEASNNDNVTYQRPIELQDIHDYLNCEPLKAHYWPMQINGDWVLVCPVERISEDKLKMGETIYTYTKEEYCYAFVPFNERIGQGSTMNSNHDWHTFPLVFFIENEEAIAEGKAAYEKMKLPQRKREEVQYIAPNSGYNYYHFAYLVKDGKKKLIADAESREELTNKLKKKRLTRFDTVLIVQGKEVGSW